MYPFIIFKIGLILIVIVIQAMMWYITTDKMLNGIYNHEPEIPYRTSSSFLVLISTLSVFLTSAICTTMAIWNFMP